MNRNTRAYRALALTLSLVLLPVGALALTPVPTAEPAPSPTAEPTPERGETTLTLLSVTDLHGYLEPAIYYNQTNLGTPVPGMVRLGCYVDSLRDENTLLLSQGDNFGNEEQALSAIDHGLTQVRVMNALGMDFSALGNHELDDRYLTYDPAQARWTWRTDQPGRGMSFAGEAVLPLADFPYTSAANSVGFPAQDAATSLGGWAGVWGTEVDGVQVAVLGAITPSLHSYPASLGSTAAMTVAPIAARADEIATDLKARDLADVVIVAQHERAPTSQGAARAYGTSVDVVLGGHVHWASAATFTRTDGGTLVSAMPAPHGRGLIQTTLTVDPQGEVSAAVVVHHEVLASECQGDPYRIQPILDQARARARAIDPGLTSRFLDVSAALSFNAEIEWLAARGLTTGWDEGDGAASFRPYLPVSRDAMITFLYRLAGAPPTRLPAASPFRDITPATPFYREIVWAHQTGVSTGWKVGKSAEFRPYEPVERAAIAAFLHRASGSPRTATPATSPFVDVATTDAFYPEIVWAYASGITTGWVSAAGSEFHPLEPASRDAVAAFLYRFTGGQ